jgi:hypothetical protein
LLTLERDWRLWPKLRCTRECKWLHVWPGRRGRDRRRHIDAGVVLYR